MFCFCPKKLQALQAEFKLPKIDFALPAGSLDAMAKLSALMSANASASAAAALSATAIANLNAAFSATANMKLSLLASVTASLKASGVANLSMGLGLGGMLGSLNMHWPHLKGLLLPNLPHLPAINALGLLAALLGNLKMNLKIDLTSPKAVIALKAKLEAIIAAKMALEAKAALAAKASVSATAKLAASVSATAALAASAQASFAAQMSILLKGSLALGLPFTPPDPLSQLAAMVQAMLAFNLPALTVPPLELAQLTGLLAAVANIKMGLGINLLASGSASLVASFLAKIDLKAVIALAASLDLKASAAMSVQAAAALAAQAKVAGALSAKLDATLSPLNVGKVGSLSLALLLSDLLGLSGLKLPKSPCEICAFLK